MNLTESDLLSLIEEQLPTQRGPSARRCASRLAYLLATDRNADPMNPDGLHQLIRATLERESLSPLSPRELMTASQHLVRQIGPRLYMFADQFFVRAGTPRPKTRSSLPDHDLPN